MKSYKSGLSWNFLSIALQNLTQILTLVILSRLLSPEDFGISAIAVVTVGLIQTLAQLGIPAALIQKEYLNIHEAKVSFQLMLLLALAGSIITYIFSGNISIFFKEPELKIIIIIMLPTIISSSVYNFIEIFFLRQLEYKIPALINATSYFTGYGLISIILAKYDFGASSIAYGILAQNITKLILSILAVKQKKIHIKFCTKVSDVKSILNFGIINTISQLGIILSTNIDNIIIGKYTNLNQLGHYTRAYSLMLLPSNLIGQVIDKTMFPFFSRIKNNQQITEKYYYFTLTLSFMVSVPTTIFLYLSSYELISIFLGTQWGDVVVVFKILCIGIIFRINCKINESILKSAGKVKSIMTIQWANALLILSGSYFGIAYGITGVATAVVFSIIITSILFNIAIISMLNKIKRVTLKKLVAYYSKYIMISISIISISYFINLQIEEKESFHLITRVVIKFLSVTVASIFILFLPFFFKEEKQLIKSIFAVKSQNVN